MMDKMRHTHITFASINFVFFVCLFVFQIRGFYKGLASPLVGQGIITLVLFGVEGNVQKGYIEHHLPPSVHPVTSPFISGMIAGMAQSFFICPMDLIKIRVQHQGIGERTESRSLKSIMFSDHSCNNKPLRGPIIVVKNTYRTGGLTGYYRGILPTFLGNGIGGGIYFSAYGNIKLQLHRRVFTESELLPSFIAGGLAGVCSYTPLYYLDVMKGRLQIDGEHGERQYKGLVDCFLKTYKEGGVRLLYKGLTPLLLWISTFGAAVFPTVEFVKMQFSSSKAGET